MRKSFTAAIAAFCMATVSAQFSAPLPIEESEFAYMSLAAVADLNGDGANDIVAAGQGNFDDIGFFINDGAGGFSPIQWIDTETFTDYAVTPIAGDVDGDGDNDVIAIENYTRVFLFENLGGAQFGPAELIVPTVGDIRRQELVDVDGDTDLDLVLLDYWEGALNWYPNMGGSFGLIQTVVTGLTGVSAMNWADVDGDADLDVLAVNYQGAASLFRNNGNGSFGLAQSITDMGTNVYDVNTADLDGDGDLDLLGGSSFDDLSVWYANNGTGFFGPAQTIADNITDWYTNNVADMDGDGDMDVIPTAYGQAPFWCENNGAGQFVAQHPVSQAFIGEARVADMDADGDADVVTLYGSISWQPNDGTGNMGHRRMICTTVTGISGLRVADLDADGDLDVAADQEGEGSMLLFYRNDGTGGFGVAEVALDTVFAPGHFEFVDLDGDADNDLVVQGYYTLACYMNDGSALFTPGAMLNVGGQGTFGLCVRDFDGDSDPDIVYVDYYADAIELRLNDGSGNFSASQIAVSIPSPRGVQAADFDGDGDEDLMSYDSGSGQLKWYANDGSGNFTAVVIATPADALEPDLAQCADFNGDGTTDLLFVDWDAVTLYLNSGGGLFQAPIQPFALGDSYPAVHASDVDGDGDIDLLIGTQDAEQFFWKANDGTGAFGPDQMLMADVGGIPQGARMGDLDGDGHSDIVLGHGNGNDSYGIHWFESFVSSNYHILGTAYYDEDENGTQDPGEGGLPFLLAMANPTASMPLTNGNGDFDISADEGTYDVHVITPELWGLTTTPASYQVTVDDLTPTSTGNDFGYAPIIDTTMLELGINASVGPCFGSGVHMLSVTNLGTTQPSGSICYALDAAYTFVSATPAPTSMVGNTLCWDYDSLFFYSQQLIQVNVINPDTSALNDPVNCVLTVTEEDDLGAVINTFTETYGSVVTCAWDPNDKQVSPAGYGDAGAVDIGTDYLDFRIRFQNTGNATATDVVLRDQLSTNLDWSTLQVIGHSHEVTSAAIGENGQLVVRFNNIQLPDSGTSFGGSQGFFSYRMQLLPGLPHGTVINNTASIFFDLNPAVVTNTTTTTLVDCDLWSVADITSPAWSVLHAPAGDAYQWFLDGSPITGAIGQDLVITEDGDYTVEVTSPFGCVAVSGSYSAIDVGVHENSGSVVAVIPNPFSQQTQVMFREELIGGSSLFLVDVNGRVVRTLASTGGKSVTIQRDGLATGLYTLRVQSPDGSFSAVRLVIQP